MESRVTRDRGYDLRVGRRRLRLRNGPSGRARRMVLFDPELAKRAGGRLASALPRQGGDIATQSESACIIAGPRNAVVQIASLAFCQDGVSWSWRARNREAGKCDANGLAINTDSASVRPRAWSRSSNHVNSDVERPRLGFVRHVRRHRGAPRLGEHPRHELLAPKPVASDAFRLGQHVLQTPDRDPEMVAHLTHQVEQAMPIDPHAP